MELLQVKKLSKNYFSQQVLNQVSFSLNPNSITALVGVNGAGKSTLLKIISNLLSYQEGEILLNGKNLDREANYFQRKIRFLNEVNPIYEDLTVWEYLSYIDCIYGAMPKKPKQKKSLDAGLEKRIFPLMEMLSILARKDSQIGNLSKGLKQRVGILASLIGDPELILFDEPFSGLDPQQIIEMRDFFFFLKKKVAILFSTHLLSEVNHLADQVVFINQGKIVGEEKIDSTNSLENNFSTRERKYSSENLHRIFPSGFYRLDLSKQIKEININQQDLSVKFVIDGNLLYLENKLFSFFDLFKQLKEKGCTVKKINLFEKKLEDKFLDYLKKP